PLIAKVELNDFIYMICWSDISNSVSDWANRKEMGDGSDISVGGWPFLLGRPFFVCGNRLIECNILYAL
ncbi:hypothetical protein KJ032_27190, partial [Salmonella enterica subsp. enterica serovar Typhimurium]|nr:hypothetical protein [Salmonella enterica subsp. enterica serovar Typhimurium]